MGETKLLSFSVKIADEELVKTYLTLPVGILGRELGMGRIIELQDDLGNSWNVMLSPSDPKKNPLNWGLPEGIPRDTIRGLSYLTHFWKSFAKEAELKTDELIIFYLIDYDHFRVRVYDKDQCQRAVLAPKKTGPRRPDLPCWSKASFYHEVHATCKSHIEIPQKFVARFSHICKRHDITLMRKGMDQRWTLKNNFVNRPDHKFFSEGWNEFQLENLVCLGDIVVFRLFGCHDVKFTATIYQGSGLESEKFTADEIVDAFDDAGAVEVEERLHSPMRVVASIGEMEFTERFERRMKKVVMVNKLELPKDFLVDSGFEVGQGDAVMLENSEVGRWEGSFGECKHGRGTRNYIAARCWIQFLRGNNIVAGNMLSFQTCPLAGNVLRIVKKDSLSAGGS